jgi:pilus assembly protein Flp/PilA
LAWITDPERTWFMRGLYQSVARFVKAEDGPTAVEYAVMLALIIVVCITAITALGTNANAVFSNVALNTAVTAS